MPFQCGGCNSTFEERKNLLRHERSKHGNEVFKCENCPFTSNRKDSLMRHILKSHSESRKRKHEDDNSQVQHSIKRKCDENAINVDELTKMFESMSLN